jgi:hypothetical protein
MLAVLRRMRDSSASLRLIHSALRGPYYTIILHPRGNRVVLSGNVQVRLAPRLGTLRPAEYEPVLSGILDQYLRAGMMVLDVGAHVCLHTLRFINRVGLPAA